MTSSSTSCAQLVVVSVLCALTGCSGETDPNDSNGVPASDAGTDVDGASIPETWPVHVEVVDLPANSAPLSVLVSTVDGTQYDLVTTNGQGKVDVQVPHLGSVAVFQTVLGHGQPEELTLRYAHSFNLVDEETTVRVPLAIANASAAPEMGPVTFTADPTTLPVGTAELCVELPCRDALKAEGPPTNPITAPASSACYGATEYYAMALALDGEGKALGATVLEHLPVTSEPQAHTLVFGGTTTFTNLDSNLAPVDPSLDYVSIKLASIPSGATYGEFPWLVREAGIAQPIGDQKLVLPVVTSFFTSFQLTARITHPDLGGLLERGDVRVASPTSIPSSFDLDVTSLAPIESVVHDTATLERPSVSFTLAQGELGNCIQATTTWITSGAQPVFWIWSTKVRSSADFRIPELPAALSSWAPGPQSDFVEWPGAQGVWHQARSEACAMFTPADTQSRYARAPLPDR